MAIVLLKHVWKTIYAKILTPLTLKRYFLRYIITSTTKTSRFRGFLDRYVGVVVFLVLFIVKIKRPLYEVLFYVILQIKLPKRKDLKNGKENKNK